MSSLQTWSPLIAWRESLLDLDSKASLSGKKHFSLRKEQPFVFRHGAIVGRCPLSTGSRETNARAVDFKSYLSSWG